MGLDMYLESVPKIDDLSFEKVLELEKNTKMMN